MNKTLKVVITNIAKNDIKQITDYISKDNKIASLKIIDNLNRTFELLADFPQTGSIKKEVFYCL